MLAMSSLSMQALSDGRFVTCAPPEELSKRDVRSRVRHRDAGPAATASNLRTARTRAVLREALHCAEQSEDNQ
jgi:hypothetical protein